MNIIYQLVFIVLLSNTVDCRGVFFLFFCLKVFSTNDLMEVFSVQMPTQSSCVSQPGELQHGMFFLVSLRLELPITPSVTSNLFLELVGGSAQPECRYYSTGEGKIINFLLA